MRSVVRLSTAKAAEGQAVSAAEIDGVGADATSSLNLHVAPEVGGQAYVDIHMLFVLGESESGA